MFRLLVTSSIWGTVALFADLWAVVLAMNWMMRRNSPDWLPEFTIETLYVAIPSTVIGVVIGAIVLPVATSVIVYCGISRSFWALTHALAAGAICYLGAVLFVRIAFGPHEFVLRKYPFSRGGGVACLAGMAAGWRLSSSGLI
jgi:hypothetical protein